MALFIPTASSIPSSPVITRSERGSPDVHALRQAVYSRKGRSVLEKLGRQLREAMHDVSGSVKCTECANTPFVVPIPEDLPGKILEFAPLTSGVAQHIGSREIQEDRFLQGAPVIFHYAKKEFKGVLFGIFDGHGDQGKVGEFFGKHLSYSLGHLLNEQAETLKGVTEETITNALAGVFPLLSKAYRERGGMGGATATCVFIYDNKAYCPNVGDSRIILVKPGIEFQLTEDADPSKARFQNSHLKDESESEILLEVRENDQIGYIDLKDWPKTSADDKKKYHVQSIQIALKGAKEGLYPDEPLLNMARNIGAYKWMSHRPKITRIFLEKQFDHLPLAAVVNNRLYRIPILDSKVKIHGHKGCFLVLASDGLYEPATIKEVGRAVRALAKEGASPQQIAELLASHAGSYKKNDNVTVMVVAL